MGYQWVSWFNCGVDLRGLTWLFSQEKVTEMQWDLLITNFKDPKMIALVKEIVGQISSGSSSHCAGTLKLGLKKAFELKKKKKWSRGVLLRCPYSSCLRRSLHISASSTGANGFCCQLCLSRGLGSRFLQCAGCGYDRTGNYRSCQRCGERFA